jgi:hypothetical protein
MHTEKNKGEILKLYVIQQCFVCRPSESTVSEDAGIEPRTVMKVAVIA